MTTALQRFQAALAEADDLNRAAAVLEWDLETYMPAGGVEDRVNHLSTLRRLAHERFVSDGMRGLLEAAELEVGERAYDSYEASLVRVTRRDLELDARVPSLLVAEIAEVGAANVSRWHAARQASDWSLFEPCMRETVEISRRLTDAIGYRERPYDALLARSEPGLTTRRVEVLFEELKAAIVPLLHDILERSDRVDDSALDRELDVERQLSVSMELALQVGFDASRGRRDISAHPFCIPFGPGDVRFTTRVRPTARDSCLFSTLHETGHAIYNQGIPRSLARTPLWDGASPAVHESQSRLWENMVGRSRPFWTFAFPLLQRSLPEQLGDLDAEIYYRAVNRVRPSYIRVDADELTYNLHIMLRFEIENDLLEGRLRVEDVPDAWNARLQRYLGLPPPSAADGPLQDMHWSMPVLGGFVGYTLGNLIGAQMMERVREGIPDLDAQMRAGDFEPILDWLRSSVYAHGRKLTPDELVERVTGSRIGSAAWIAYARHKFGQLYALD
ncbi:MAG: carboxypeptidase [Candidatus Nephthysia bennettiae]|uniref:Metal-dependent carboxypeptidase n=1 Tax=Candidatus Nephthysia bennettiae TaxID=3127016 RepID=A0A934N7N2_9BACT|nr:carboxypeptidase M32 [Candidatus Dormibacteraeota bacterium]MBJ7611824.1 carboxypeptidase M32 [Candidatus Dormibacteraeota bacterium]PZR99451.1 MAG: carboxypeptidase [Candidatus Dormibacteraeota bacterium]